MSILAKTKKRRVFLSFFFILGNGAIEKRCDLKIRKLTKQYFLLSGMYCIVLYFGFLFSALGLNSAISISRYQCRNTFSVNICYSSTLT